MRVLGTVLMGLGVAVGMALAVAMVAGQSIPWLAALPWLVAVGVAKLTFISALGLIAVGAAMRRLARRAAERSPLHVPQDNRRDR